MAIKIFCNICDKFIREISQTEVSKITGEEVCAVCQKKINNAFMELDNAEKEFQKAINQIFTDAKKDYVTFQNKQNQKLQEIKSIINNTRPEIGRIVRDIIQKEKLGKEKKETAKDNSLTSNST